MKHTDLQRHRSHSLLLADVAQALIRADSLRTTLQMCAQAMVDHLSAAFARIWTLSSDDAVLVLEASAGMYTHINGPHGRVPVGKFKIGRIAEECRPHLTNDVLHDDRISDPAWARREGMVAFAGYPLTVEGRVIGVMAMFSREILPDDTLDALAAVADALALGIERKRADESRRLFQALVEKTRDFIGFTSASGEMLYLNAAGRKLVGFTAEEDAGRRKLSEFCEPVVEAEGEAEFRHLRTGEVIPVHRTAFRILDERGELRSVALVARDLRAWKKEEQKREELIEALQRSNRDLDQFAYVASHDLKAPLRGIANLSQWLEEDLQGMGEDSRHQMKLLRSRVHRLEALIEGILQYSRAGRVRGHPERIDLSSLVAQVVELLSPPEETNIEVQSPLPTVVSERVPLQQILLNLLGNALKHAGKDAEIQVGAVRHGRFCEIFVKDNGPGIAPEFHDRIWGIFQTLERRDDVESTGIGLALVKKICEAYGGRAWVESTPGHGATFWVRWPAMAERKD